MVVGNAFFVHGNGSFGVELEDGAANDTINSSVVSGQQVDGIAIAGAGTDHNTVLDSEIGTDPTATRVVRLGRCATGQRLRRRDRRQRCVRQLVHQ